MLQDEATWRVFLIFGAGDRTKANHALFSALSRFYIPFLHQAYLLRSRPDRINRFTTPKQNSNRRSFPTHPADHDDDFPNKRFH